MRGTDSQQSAMFSYISAERRVPKDHRPRAIRVMTDAALEFFISLEISADLIAAIAGIGLNCCHCRHL